MYRNNTYINVIIEQAEQNVMKYDRVLYNQYFETIEQFCAENNFIIGGKVGLDILLENPLSYNDYSMEIYGANVYKAAMELTKKLYELPEKHIPKKYIELKTDINDTELTIFINLRRICKIYKLDLQMKGNTINIIKPQSFYGFWYKEKKIMYLPEELQLIDIYRALYDPAKNGQWSVLFETAQKLYAMSEKYLFQKITGLISPEEYKKTPVKDGGYDICPIFNIESGEKVGSAELSNRKIVMASVIKLLKFLKEYGVIIGDYAIHPEMINEPEKNSYKRLQFLIDLDIQEVVNVVKASFPNASFKFFRVNIVSDFRIKKWSIYVNEVSVCDVFNAPAYELIPYKVLPKGYKIGNLFVLMRFKLIDLWIMRIVNSLEKLKESNESQKFKIKNTENKIKGILDDIAEIDKRIRITENLMELFQLDDYYGIYYPDDIAKKQLIKSLGYGKSYYPAKI